MYCLNKDGNGACMTNSIDLICNSISLIQPDGSIQPFTGTVGGIDAASVAQLALHTSQIAQNTNSISSLVVSTNHTFASQRGLINANTASIAIINKATLGLSDVDNASDVNKPLSTATQTALNLKADATSLNKTGVGVANDDHASDLNKPISTATQH